MRQRTKQTTHGNRMERKTGKTNAAAEEKQTTHGNRLAGVLTPKRKHTVKYGKTKTDRERRRIARRAQFTRSHSGAALTI